MVVNTIKYCLQDSDTDTTPATAQGAEKKEPSKKQPAPKRRKVSSSVAAGASRSQNPPDDKSVSKAAAEPVDALNRTPTKARITRSGKSFKGKHVLHVAEYAASPDADEAAPVEAAHYKPARKQRLSLTIAAGGSTPLATTAKRQSTFGPDAQAPFRKMPPYRKIMLSAVRDVPAGQDGSTASRVQQLATTLAGDTPNTAAADRPQTVRL